MRTGRSAIGAHSEAQPAKTTPFGGGTGVMSDESALERPSSHRKHALRQISSHKLLIPLPGAG
jgi:hypothetical protein